MPSKAGSCPLASSASVAAAKRAASVVCVFISVLLGDKPPSQRLDGTVDELLGGGLATPDGAPHLRVGEAVGEVERDRAPLHRRQVARGQPGGVGLLRPHEGGVEAAAVLAPRLEARLA